jgi:hypothetical protein
MASLAHQIDDGPVFFPLLKMIQGQCHDFVSSQPTREHESQQSAVSFSIEPLLIRSLPKRLSLLCCQPVTKSNAQLLYALNSTNPRCQVGTQKTAISCFIRQTAHGT